MARSSKRRVQAALFGLLGAAAVFTPTSVLEPVPCEGSGTAFVEGGRLTVQDDVPGADTPQCVEATKPALVSQDPPLCEKSAWASVQAGRYIVQNNIWGADTPQCVEAKPRGGFSVTRAGHSSDANGKPAAYPSIYAGCHFGKCSRASGLPMSPANGDFGKIKAAVSVSYVDDGSWNAAFDMWLDPAPRTDGQNEGAEIMVWFGKRGPVHPIGSREGTVTLDGVKWEVWYGSTSWNVVSYVSQSNLSSLELRPQTFAADAIARGYARREWYLTSLQVGFETWAGGEGLAVNSFSYSKE